MADSPPNPWLKYVPLLTAVLGGAAGMWFGGGLSVGGVLLGIAGAATGLLGGGAGTLAYAYGTGQLQLPQRDGDNSRTQREIDNQPDHDPLIYTIDDRDHQSMVLITNPPRPAPETIIVKRHGQVEYTVRGHQVPNQARYQVDSITDASGHTWTPSQSFTLDLLAGQLRLNELEAEWARQRQGGQSSQQQPSQQQPSQQPQVQERLPGDDPHAHVIGSAGNGSEPNREALGSNHHLITVNQNGSTSWIRARLTQGESTQGQQIGHVYLRGQRVDQDDRPSSTGNRFRLDEVIFRDQHGVSVPVRLRGTAYFSLNTSGQIDISNTATRTRLGGIIGSIYSRSPNVRLAMEDPNIHPEIQDATRGMLSMVTGGQHIERRPEGLPNTPDATVGIETPLLG